MAIIVLWSRLKLFAFLISIWISTTEQTANFCNVNGKTHQVGESWTTSSGNNLKRCTCTRRGQWNCGYVKEDALLVVADVSRLAKVKLSGAIGFETPYVQNLPGRIVSVDVDIESDTIYWTDVSYKGRGIYKAAFSNGKSIRRFIQDDVFEPNGIAVDWLAKNIYWTDAQMGAIYAARENGQHRTMVLGGLSEPRAIVVLPLRGLMFWSDQSDGTIEAASMDGTKRKVIIRGLKWPNEIAVDATRNKVFWIDGKKRTIESCNFDGTSWKLIHDFTLAFDRPGFGLSLFGNRLYFSVWEENAVYSVTVLGQDLKRVSGSMHNNVGGLAIVNKKIQQAPISSNVGLCRAHMMPCSHMCLPQSRGSYTCACPEKSGLVLSRNQHDCEVPKEFILYTSVQDGSIMILSKEPGVKPSPVLLAQGDQPSAIDYDPTDNMVYWSDVSTNAIYRMHLNGTKRERFLEDGIGIVDGIAVDWVNKHLYFTNYGWESEYRQFHRIEMIGLNKLHRKVIVYEDIEKPRDIVIDHRRGFLYYSDWGSTAKVMRVDMDGQNPHLVPIDVENPNGLALDNGVLYVTDSHRKSALVSENGTIIYGRPPSLIKYDTVLGRLDEDMSLGFEIPFGLSMDNKKLYVTDWSKDSISEVDIDAGTVTVIANGIKKPTGIVRASLKLKKIYVNECTKTKPCSHICVPVDQDHSSCVCPDQTGLALAENDWRCVAPDRFILIADMNKILMKSISPVDHYLYMVARTFDSYSNIVAVTYDPMTYYVYWADNGRQRICRKGLSTPLGSGGRERDDIEVIYTNIEMVEGMALDPENRLLYWTDGGLNTIEVLDLNGMIHSTILENLNNPRAIALDPSMGIMYWTEWGKAAMLITAKMNGFDLRPLLTTGLEWPNGLFYDAEKDKVYVADGAKLKIQSISPIEGDTLDHIDLNGTVGHLFGLGKLGSSLLYTDWTTGSVYKGGFGESEVLLRNLTRPTQIHVQSTFIPERISQCSTAMHECSHICVPSPGSYTCLCPDHLVLANNMRNCVRPENLHLYTTTLEPPVFEDFNITTAPWAELGTDFTEVEEMHTLKIELLPETTTQANTTAIAATMTTGVPASTVKMTTVEQTTTTTIPPPPRFPLCQSLGPQQTANFTVLLPDTQSYVELTADLIGLRALNNDDKDLKITPTAEQIGKVFIGELELTFTATDKYGRKINCTTFITVKDTTPPVVAYCPGDLDVESYSYDETTFVTWDTPRFTDNSMAEVDVVSTHTQGQFVDGIHNITYIGIDESGNKAMCTFLLAVIHRKAKCGNPWTPPHSFLTCYTDPVTTDHVCQITCEKEYRLTLKEPFVRCRGDPEKYSSDWLPFLDDNVCKLPSIGNPQQIITISYPCPCRPTNTFYDYTLQIMTGRLREAVGCIEQEYELGFCVNAHKKLSLECINSSRVDFSIKVDLAKLTNIRKMTDATGIVKRSVTTILDKAAMGEIQTRGSDMIDYSPDLDINLSNVNIICRNGYKGVEDGCVACPRGTFYADDNCEFCPVHTFQEKSAMINCMNCSSNTGTRNKGSTHRSHCVKMVRVEQQSSFSILAIIASVIGGLVVIAIIVAIVLACWYKRRQRKKIKEEEARRRRKERARRRRNSLSGSRRTRPVAVMQPPVEPQLKTVALSLEGDEFSDARTISRRSNSSGKRVTIKEGAIEHRIPHHSDRSKEKDKRMDEPSWRQALVMRNTNGMKLIGKMVKTPKRAPPVRKDDERSVTSAKEYNPDEEKSQFSETDTDHTMTETETGRSDTEVNSVAASISDASTVRDRRLMSSTSDLGDETMSMTSGASSRATTPIKGVLKKPKRIMSMDDSLVSDSTLSNTIENSRTGDDSRGRGQLQKTYSQRMGRSSSPPKQEPRKPVGIRRSNSLDRGPSAIGPGPHKMFDRDPRFFTMGPRRNLQHMRPGILGDDRMNQPRPMFHGQMPPPNSNIPKGGLPPGIPAGPGIPQGVRPRFMGAPQQRMMTRPPPGSVIYRHPNHPNMRMAFVPMNQGGRPMMPPGRMPMPPPYSNDGYWQGSPDWDNSSISGSDLDMRKPPRHMMPPMSGYPRPMYPRVRLANGGMMVRHPGNFNGAPGPPYRY